MIEQTTGRYDSGGTASLCVLWTGVLCAGFFLYGLTAQQGVSWQDSGMLQWRILTGDYAGNLGLALAHPLYIAIGRLFLLIPFAGDFALLNFCSGAGMAVTLANIFVLGFLLTGRRWIGLMTAGMLAVMHTPWWLSTIAEVYTWNAAFFTAELIFFIVCIRKPSPAKLAGLFLCNGLNLSVHNVALLSLPVYGTWALFLVYRRRLPPVCIALAGAAYICGAAPLVWLVIQEMLQTGSFQAAVESMLFGRYASDVFNVSLNQPLMGVNAALSSLNFMHVGLLLGVVGWVNMRITIGRPFAWSLFVLLCLQGFFFLRYSVPDQFTFIVPTLVLFSLGMAVGMDMLARRSSAWKKAVVAACLLSIVLMPLTYAVLPLTLEALHVDATRARALPFRDEMRYWLVPWKNNEHSAEQFARTALLEVAPDGLIVCDGTSYYPLILMKERMQGTEAVLIEHYTTMARRYAAAPEALALLLRERKVFVVSPVLNFISEDYLQGFEFSKKPDQILYRLSVVRHSAI